MITKDSNRKNPLWFKDAIIYQLHVRSFYDSNGDGVGDFPGLTEKLDYLSELGITAIWLQPFYPSPLRDDGYDIADYTQINPSYGTIEDFQEFLTEAHRRNIRVITELVINHTSDQHEWFQKSRRSEEGSYWRNFYVWSDNPNKYKGTRIIFKDFEVSNWTWDPLAKSYYWHRFYSHQPDLNFDNPDVQKAVFGAFDFWMEMGVDGMRLDAIPYLFERENTSSENLPETHAYLKKLRAYLDERYPGTMLLAEANQWPEDAAAYFGEGDECHMNFHFPLMPRLFMALKMEDRYSIVDILKQTPEIPDNCQWAIFLRNHDEMTLEMVTDEERDYMYKVYANDPRARINLGVRHRLSPLVGNDRKQIELLNSLLFSLPGSPIIYYGDEIGMGDNIYLGDRDGVRTPFQWSLDRNAGFSQAHPQKLFLPVISSPEYPAENVNVEMQRNDPNSLLWWMIKMINLRLSSPVLSRGRLDFLPSTNSKILTYCRSLDGESVVCAVNLSRNAQYAEVDLSDFKGQTPFEILGQTEFQKVGDTPYFLTMHPYSFYWFKFTDKAQQTSTDKLTEIELDENPMEALHRKKIWRQFSGALGEYLKKQSWFRHKERKITRIERFYRVALQIHSDKLAELLILRVHCNEGLPEYFLMGLLHIPGVNLERQEEPESIIAKTVGVYPGIIMDAFADQDFCIALASLIVRKTGKKRVNTEIVGEYLDANLPKLSSPFFGSKEQSNSWLIFPEGLFVKFYRHLDRGVNPEIELGRFMREQEYEGTGRYLGSLSFEKGYDHFSLAIAQQALSKENDGWNLIVDQLAQMVDRLTQEQYQDCVIQEPDFLMQDIHKAGPPEALIEIAGYSLSLVHELAIETAKMHLSLGSADGESEFATETYTPFLQRSLFQSLRNLADRSLELLKKKLELLPSDTQELAKKVLAQEEALYEQLSYIKNTPIECLRIRIHGDFHLGQVVYSGKKFYIVDFEGDSRRSVGERKLKNSPLKDIAGILFSLNHAAGYQLQRSLVREQDYSLVQRGLRTWAYWAQSVYLRSYLEFMEGSELLPSSPEQLQALLDVHILEKSLNEIEFELRQQQQPEFLDLALESINSRLIRAKT